MLTGLRGRFDRVAWVRRLKRTRLGQALRKVTQTLLGTGGPQSPWRLSSEPIDVSCHLCGSSRCVPLCDNAIGLPVVRCSECGLIYLRKQPAPADTETRYDGYMVAERARWNWDEWMQERSGRLDDWGIGELERTLPSDRRVLELGCAEGYQLEVFRRRGWQVKGYDVDARAVRHAVEMLGLDALRCPLDAIPEPDETYDLVVLFHTIEHVAHALSTTEEVCRVLKPCGRLLIVTPCSDTEVSRSVGDIWFSDPDHMVFFSQRTIRLLLEKTGFAVLDLRSWLGVASPDGESGVAVHRAWRTAHTVDDDARVVHRNQGDVMMVMAAKLDLGLPGRIRHGDGTNPEKH